MNIYYINICVVSLILDSLVFLDQIPLTVLEDKKLFSV